MTDIPDLDAGPDNPFLAQVQRRQQRDADAVAKVRDRAGELAAHAARPTAGETYTAADWEFILEGVPDNTRRTYRRAWMWILTWTGSHGYTEVPMPVETCVKMIRDHWQRAGRYGRPASPATLSLTLTVLTIAHRHAKRPDGTVGYVSPVGHPDVQKAFRTYKKRWLQDGHRPDLASPITPEELHAMVQVCNPGDPRGARNALALTLLFDMGARRSELLAINFGDVDLLVRDPHMLAGVDWRNPSAIELAEPEHGRPSRDRLIVHVPMSKTDQEGAGDEVVLPAHPQQYASTCPVRRFIVWRALLVEVGLQVSGPVLRQVLGGGPMPADGRPRRGTITGERMEVEGLELMLSRGVEAAGLDDREGRVRRHFTLHGFRSGSAEAAAEAGADTPELNRHFRWSQMGTTAQQYAAHGLRRSQNPAARIWRSSGE